MNDYQATLKLFKRLGIKPTIGKRLEQTFDGDFLYNLLTIESHTENVKGYLGFFATFIFDENGKFIEAGVWE